MQRRQQKIDENKQKIARLDRIAHFVSIPSQIDAITLTIDARQRQQQITEEALNNTTNALNTLISLIEKVQSMNTLTNNMHRNSSNHDHHQQQANVQEMIRLSLSAKEEQLKLGDLSCKSLYDMNQQYAKFLARQQDLEEQIASDQHFIEEQVNEINRLNEMYAPNAGHAKQVTLEKIGTKREAISSLVNKLELYQHAMTEFEQNINAPNHDASRNNLQKSAKHLLKTLNESRDINIANRTKIVVAANDLYNDHTNPDKQLALANAQYLNPHGRRSKNELLVGAIMLVLGAALIATCVTFAVLTGGITAPLMIYGLATGAILLTGGVVACMAGRQKGIDKALSNYNHAANKPQHSPCLFASYQTQNERTESSNNILTIRP